MKLFQKLPDASALVADNSRDVAIDAIRTWSLAVVVLGHFIMQIVYWSPQGIPVGSNTLSSAPAWPFITWLLQVMPLFFLAGGAVNRASWERFNGTYAQWLWKRLQRLLRPTLFLLGILGVVFTVLTAVGNEEVIEPLCIGMVGPLWFLAIYVPVISLTGITSRWHQRYGLRVVVVLTIAAIVFDALRFTVNSNLSIPNVLVAWTIAHQLGYFYADGVNRSRVGLIAVAALIGNIVLTQVFKLYPTSMVGLPSDATSNANPPSVAMVLHILFLCCGFMFLAERIRAFFSRPRPALLTAKFGVLAMSLYLWHMPVLVMSFWVLHIVGWDLPTVWLGDGIVVPAGPNYWLWMIPWTATYGLLVYTVLRVVWPLEYIKVSWLDSDAKGSWRPPVWLGPTCAAVGLLAIAGTSFTGFPLAVKTLYGLPISNAAALLSVILGLFCARAAARPKLT